jgi:hypothetical protein
MRRAVMVAALGSLLAGAPVVEAGMVAVRTVYDFGSVEQGTPIVHQFALKNTGRGMVRIEGSTASCGCTVAAIDGRLVRPRQLTWVPVTVDTSQLSGKTTKTVTLKTSDPQTPQVLLAVSGTVLTDLIVAPSTVYLGWVWRGDPARHDLVVGAGRPGNFGYTVSSVETESSALHARLEPGDKPGEQKVVVELDYDAPPGRFNELVTLHTTSPRQPVITVPVFGHITG